LFTQHSVTTEFERARDQVRPALQAVAQLAEDGIQVIVTYPNNDAGGQAIIEELAALAARNIPNVQVHRSLGRHLYHGVLALAKDPTHRVVCVGNSSSGIKETPAFHCPTVNIGSRQDGRLRGANVIDVGYDCPAILRAVHRGLFDEGFRERCRRADNPYYLGDAGPKIADVLAAAPIDQRLLRKRMTLRGEAPRARSDE
jgi:UDP-N-acetylglucosamine 2-epimerase (non-hydrolysing)/GDP/UDP-N,N'-diacetylbacillosamine 2-epimerase (hydrolysing)